MTFERGLSSHVELRERVEAAEISCAKALRQEGAGYTKKKKNQKKRFDEARV